MAMDIEDILTNQHDELLEVDLRSLEVELDTGEYSKQYIAHCHELIQLIRKQRALAQEKLPGKGFQKHVNPPLSQSPLTVPASSLSPFGQEIKLPEPTDAEKLARDLEVIRQTDNPEGELKRYFEKTKNSEAFIDANFSAFNESEHIALMKCFDFSETFLEKYFDVLDHTTLAKTQHFSEEFFVKHYADLNPDLVIKHGVNEWRAKENRSSKLDVFLRLKGVRY